MLQEIFGEIRLVEAGAELYAEYETPLERVVLSVGGALPGGVAGGRFGAHLRVPLDANACWHAGMSTKMFWPQYGRSDTAQ